ncbi:MAG: M48 family metallopeptidase [Candidatus Gygaella obscura]|nr:M48 family metallopeptidase [Candidatus Gygaella obscura]
MNNKSKEYQAIKNSFFFLEISLNILLLSLLFFLGGSHLLKDLAIEISNNYYLTLFIYFSFLSMVFYIVFFPISFYSQFVLEHKFNLSRESSSQWFKKNIKKAVISFVFGAALIEVLYLFFNLQPGYWWLWFSLFYLVFSSLVSFILPVMILPIFYKYKPLENKELSKNIIELARNNNIKVLNVYTIDFSKETAKANAAIIGMGKTKRIVLADTLVDNYTINEIIAVLAHEFGHFACGHIRKLLFSGFVITLASLFFMYVFLSKSFLFLGINGFSDIVGFPIIALFFIIISLVAMPLQNAYSRKLEREADAFALNATNDKDSFISLMEKLGQQNLSDKNPNRLIEFLLYDHPSIASRIKLAKNYFNEY